MLEKYVYALESPIDGLIYYVGCSANEKKFRPYDHINSHNPLVKEWYNSIGSEPIVKILQRNCENLLSREKYWINKYKSLGHPLLNIVIASEKTFKYSGVNVAKFIKDKRMQTKLTQREFAKKAGVGLRFLRELEQGKESCKMDKVMQVLSMFGATLIAIDSKQLV